MSDRRKHLGQYFTPADVARSLVKWVVAKPTDRLLDPSCVDGQFLACHRRAVGVELDLENARLAQERAPGALIHGGDFFRWSAATKERFEPLPTINTARIANDIRSREILSSLV